MAKELHYLDQSSAIIIPHGKSETQIAKHIKACLRLPLFIHSKKTSIQINGLLHELKTNYPDISSLEKNDNVVLTTDKGKIINDFKIFTLMDTDDCTEYTKNKYINKTLFEHYDLKEYLVPIYTSPDLENVLYESGIISKIFSDSEKIKEYKKLFDIPKLPYGKTKAEELRELSQKLSYNKNTNLNVFIDYCIAQSEKREITY